MEVLLQRYSPPICSQYCISVVCDICGIAIIIYCSRCLLVHDDTVIYALCIPNPITGILLGTEIQAVRTVKRYSFSIGTFIIRSAIFMIGYIHAVILWRTYWINGWTLGWYFGWTFGWSCGWFFGWTFSWSSGQDTVKFATCLGDPSAVLLLFAVVKIFRALMRKRNLT
jgi:hypothetical protein